MWLARLNARNDPLNEDGDELNGICKIVNTGRVERWVRLTCKKKFGFLVLGLIGNDLESLDERIDIQLQKAVDLIWLLDSNNGRDTLSELFLRDLWEGVKNRVVERLKLDDLWTKVVLAVSTEIFHRHRSRLADLLGVGTESPNDVLKLWLQELWVVRGPLGISAERHDSGEAELLMMWDLNQDWNDLWQNYVFVLVDHAAHCAHSEKWRLELLPMWNRGRGCSSTVGAEPNLQCVEYLGQALSNTHDLAAVLQAVAHNMTEVAELLLLLAISVEQIHRLWVLWSWELELLQQDVHQLRVDVDALNSRLDVLLHDKVLLEVVPESEGEPDGLLLPISVGALQDSLDQIAEVLWLSRDQDDPGLSGLSEQTRDALKSLLVLIFGELCDPRLQGDELWQEDLDGVHVFVNLAGFLEDSAETLDC